ncbi:hypothetical protein GGH95_000420 [Coemansia sp. RSA 1836]|nr:hypothetical protein GGH95_000420 [Coemansia sp. RSA 1836]
MASKLSQFQTLPMLAVDMIVEYLEGRSRNAFYANIDDHNMYKAALAPLLLVSQHWRTAALASICDNCSLRYDKSCDTVEVTYPAWPAYLSYPSSDKSNLVRHVVVKISSWIDMHDGALSEPLAERERKYSVFPSATVLELRLGKQLYEKYCKVPENGKERTACFARSLLRVAPAADNVRVVIRYINEDQNNCNELYDTLVSEMCQANAKTLYIHSLFREIPIPLKLHGASELTSIMHDVDSFHDTFARLAYLNVRSLRTLCIWLDNESNWVHLLYDDDNVPAVYRSLAKLSLQISKCPYEVRDSEPWMAIDGVEPFPSLVELSVADGYPFVDDLLFRGNGKSMLTLSLPLKAISNNVLGRYGVLECGGVGRVNRICIGKASHRSTEYVNEQDAASIRPQVHCILETAAALHLWSDTSKYHILSAIISAPGTAVLQRLEIWNLELDAVHILHLIRALPSLVVIACDICQAGAGIAVIPAPEHSSSHFLGQDPLRNDLWKLRVPYTTIASASRIAEVAMAVATACPNFLYVDMAPRLRKEFSCHISRASQSYPDSIGRPIYHE